MFDRRVPVNETNATCADSAMEEAFNVPSLHYLTVGRF
jgi:hypothetical protein